MFGAILLFSRSLTGASYPATALRLSFRSPEVSFLSIIFRNDEDYRGEAAASELIAPTGSASIGSKVIRSSAGSESEYSITSVL